jgi:hypothetical protein
VGAFLRARTQDDDDQEIGVFSPDTRPTDDEVQKLINRAAGVVYGTVGSPDDWLCSSADDLRDQAQYWIILLVCMLIELSYFPEQVRSDRSAFQGYKDLWDDDTVGFNVFREAAIACGGSGTDPEGGSSAAFPSWDFPVDVGGLVGWQTRW